MGFWDKVKDLVGTNTRTNPPPRIMPKVKPFASGKLPASEMRQFTAEINNLVEQYNKPGSISYRKQILEEIQNKIRLVEYKFPPSYLARSPEFQSRIASLFTEIQYQLASLGTHSLHDSKTLSSPLSEVIANMSPEKGNKLLEALVSDSTGKELRDKLAKIYAGETSVEAKRFQIFLNTYQISFLGGGNSKNFKVTDNSGYSQVLKVDCRLDMPRNVEAHLREKLPENFAPIMAERQLNCKDPKGNGIISRTVLVTDFCAGGSVDKLKFKLTTVGQLSASMGVIFEQMADALLSIQEAGCFFPDAKITNWLVDENLSLRLADTKSFLFANESGVFCRGISGNEYCRELTTKGFIPPEFKYSSEWDVDSAHAYILGKNLYYYAVGNSGKGSDASTFVYDAQLFKTSSGPGYKALIQALIKKDPSERMPVREALNELFKINNPNFRDVFTQLESLGFGSTDKAMETFIREKQREINLATPGEKAKILKELQHTVKALGDDAAAKEVRNIVTDFRHKHGFFTIGMKDKAHRIEQAMGNIPIEERTALLKSEGSSDVLKALASHRYFGKRGDVYLDRKGGIDTDSAATTFKEFKAKFHNQMVENDVKVDVGLRVR